MKLVRFLDFLGLVFYHSFNMKLSKILNLLPHSNVLAHCDIPCGIYDPHNAQLAAHTIIRMTDFLGKVKADDGIIKAGHDMVRVTRVKEHHSDILEKELTTLENDYFKEEHYKEYENLGKLFSDANILGAKARQGIDLESANELLETVMQIAEIFYKSKNVEFVRVKSVYPTELQIVVQK